MATRAASRESLAIRIAERLLTDDSRSALTRAQAARDRYLRAGNVVQTDLFVGVCTVIGFRSGSAAARSTREIAPE